MLWRDTPIRLAQALAASITFSVLIGLTWSGNAFPRAALAAFIMFHGGVSPAVLGITLESRRSLLRYATAYVSNFVIIIIPTTIVYKELFGPTIFVTYDFFAGIILYGMSGSLVLIMLFSNKFRGHDT